MDDLAEILANGCTELGLEVAYNDSDRLLRYLGLIARWNRKHNLTALSSATEMVVKHLLDSLSVAAHLPNGTVLDIGSGAGLPGIPLAIARPQQSFTLLDASFKRVAFLREAKRELGLANIEPVHSRAESYQQPPFAVITCRAFSSLANLVSCSEHLLTQQGCWLAMKGQLPSEEIDALPVTVQVASVAPLIVPGLNAQRHLVKIVRA
ncbi:MAG: 16S rRNA (guanine(527)-N(7))-methyltransferase RsmG [Pseudomonadales bacterium]|nr:16S rRNA (guanine(527)-N(7))-methyltransferase RsmG [Pseudomonadales bacterium]